MDLAPTFIQTPKRPGTVDEAVQIIDALWRLLQDCREQLALESSNTSLPPSQDRLSAKDRDRFSRKSKTSPGFRSPIATAPVTSMVLN